MGAYETGAHPHDACRQRLAVPTFVGVGPHDAPSVYSRFALSATPACRARSIGISLLYEIMAALLPILSTWSKPGV